MKKIITLLAIVLIATTSFAREGISLENKKVLEGFRQEFGNISQVNWYKAADNFVAKFSLNTSKVTAHFDAEGTLLATSRNITDTQLPTPVISKLIKKFADQHIHNVVEYVTNEGTSYVITLESATEWTVLKATSGRLTVIRKLQKA